MEIDSISSRKVTVLVEVIGNGGKPVVNDLCHLKEGRMFLFLLSNHLLIIALPNFAELQKGAAGNHLQWG